MIKIGADLSVTPQTAGPATVIRAPGELRASYDLLVARLGAPDEQRSRDCGVIRWTLQSPGGWAHLVGGARCCFHECVDTETELAWTIVAPNAALPWLFQAVTGGTAGFPAAAVDDGSTAAVAKLVRVYVAYLDARCAAKREETERLVGQPEAHSQAVHIDRVLHSAAAHLSNWLEAVESERLVATLPGFAQRYGRMTEVVVDQFPYLSELMRDIHATIEALARWGGGHG